MKRASVQDFLLIPWINARMENRASDRAFNAAEKGAFWIDASGMVKFNDGVNIAGLRSTLVGLVNGDIAANAAIDLAKLAVDPRARATHTGTQTASTISDFSAAAVAALAASLSTNSTGDRNRANHTGTQLANTISNFDTQVRTNPLHTLATPLNDVSWGTYRITDLSDPTSPQDAATKAYVDAAAQGLDAKENVRLGTVPGVTGASTYFTTVDVQSFRTTANMATTDAKLVEIFDSNGGNLLVGDRVLVKDAAAYGMTSAMNGIYVVTSAGSASTPVTFARAADANTAEKLVSAFVFVRVGTQLIDTGWLNTADSFQSGFSSQPWVQFSAAGQITAGSGLAKNGTVLSVSGARLSNLLQPLPGESFAGLRDGVETGGLAVAVDGVTLNFGAAAGGSYPVQIKDGGVDLAGAKVTGTLPISKGGTGATTAAAARTALGTVGKYSTSTHAAGTTISITAATHGLGVGAAKDVVLRYAATGERFDADDTVDPATGNVTISFAASQAANSVLVTIIG